MRRIFAMALMIGLSGTPAAHGSEDPPTVRAGDASAKANEAAICGDSVGVHNRAAWRARVRGIEKIEFSIDAGERPGMAVPAADGRLRLLTSKGLRNPDPRTGKHTWIAPEKTALTNHTSCTVGVDGTAYFGNHDLVQAVDKSGKRLWRTELKASWIRRPPALSPDGSTLYVVANGLGLASLATVDGSVNWLRRDWAAPWASLTFDVKNRLLVATGQRLTCFSPDGATLWKLTTPLGNLIVDGVRLYGTLGDTGSVQCLNLRTRREIWRTPARPGVTGTALGDDGRLRVTHESGELICLDPDGAVRWVTQVSKSTLNRPATARDGDTLVVDDDGVLHLVDRAGRVEQSLALNGTGTRWRPVVTDEGAVFVSLEKKVVRVTGKNRVEPPNLVATELYVVADDFVVDVWVNGKKLAMEQRTLIAEVFGASSERIRVDLHEGDWVVFNVVANRLRWNGASYFGALARRHGQRTAFASSTQGNWSACDDVSEVKRFIAERGAGADRLAVRLKNPWSDAPGIWRQHTGSELPGDPVWGTSANTWIKCVVPPAGSYKYQHRDPERAKRKRRTDGNDEPGRPIYRGPSGPPPPDSREPSGPPPPPPNDPGPPVPPK